MNRAAELRRNPRFTIRLSAEVQHGGRTFTVSGEPEIRISDADRKARFDALKEFQVLGNQVQHAQAALRKADATLKEIKAAIKDSNAVAAPLRAALDSVTRDLDPLKKKFGVGFDFGQGNFDFEAFRKNLGFRVGNAGGGIDGSTSLPTDDQRRQLGELRTEVPAAVALVNGFLTRLPALYKQLAEAGVYPVAPKAVGKPDGER